MIYNLHKDELIRVSDLLNIGIDEVSTRLDIEDEILVISAFEDGIKIRTRKGCELILNLK